jgi:hypothetical protein
MGVQVAGQGTAGHLAVRPDQCVGGVMAGSPGRVRRPGRLGRGRRVPVRAGGWRIDGVMGQPLGRNRQIPGVGHREETAHQDGAGGCGHREPPPRQPGPPARLPPGGRGREVCAARRGPPERPELRERRGLPGQFAAFGRRRQGGEYLGNRLPPGGVTIRPGAPVRPAPVWPPLVWRALVRHATVGPVPVWPATIGPAPVQQRVQGPVSAGTVRPAAPLAFRHAALETTRRPDALHGSDSRGDSRVMRRRMLTAANHA